MSSARLRPPSTLQVSFQHEVYPVEPAPGPVAPGEELEEQPLSRQVFIVQELEIRDRLASSRINKFLYLHTSERMPRRAHSNMVLRAAPASTGQGAGPPSDTCTHTWVVGEPGGTGGLWPALRNSLRRRRTEQVSGGGWGTRAHGPAGTQSSPSAPSSPSKRCTWPPPRTWVGLSAVCGSH